LEPEHFIDPIVFIERMNEAHLRYLLVGRQAVVQYGAPVQSFDFDFYLCPEPESLETLLRIAAGLGLEHEEVDREDLPGFIRLHADNIAFDFFRARMYTTRDGTRLVFEQMWDRRVTKKGESFHVHVPCLEDLIATKRMRDPESADGIKDLEDLRYLSAIRDGFGD
jgi:hypothetical protein